MYKILLLCFGLLGAFTPHAATEEADDWTDLQPQNLFGLTIQKHHAVTTHIFSGKEEDVAPKRDAFLEKGADLLQRIPTASLAALLPRIATLLQHIDDPDGQLKLITVVDHWVENAGANIDPGSKEDPLPTFIAGGSAQWGADVPQSIATLLQVTIPETGDDLLTSLWKAFKLQRAEE